MTNVIFFAGCRVPGDGTIRGPGDQVLGLDGRHRVRVPRERPVRLLVGRDSAPTRRVDGHHAELVAHLPGALVPVAGQDAQQPSLGADGLHRVHGHVSAARGRQLHEHQGLVAARRPAAKHAGHLHQLGGLPQQSARRWTVDARLVSPLALLHRPAGRHRQPRHSPRTLQGRSFQALSASRRV